MSADGDITEYHARLAECLGPNGWAEAMDSIRASPKFLEGVATRYPGVTMMTPAGPADPWAVEVYALLQELQESLVGSMANSVIPVNPDSFHVTVGDLVAGEAYSSGCDKAISRAVKRILASLGDDDVEPDWRVAGVALFEHAVVGLLEPVSESDYLPIVELRDRLYCDLPLRALGVRRPRPLMLHVTLAYFDSGPTEADRARWNDVLEASLEACRRRSATMLVRDVGIHRFNDMSAFTPLKFG